MAFTASELDYLATQRLGRLPPPSQTEPCK